MLNVNAYFNGTVKSISFTNSKQHVSVGVMTLGERSSNASNTKTMPIISSTVRVKLANHDHWSNFTAGQHFKVSADNQLFKLKSASILHTCANTVKPANHLYTALQ